MPLEFQPTPSDGRGSSPQFGPVFLPRAHFSVRLERLTGLGAVLIKRYLSLDAKIIGYNQDLSFNDQVELRP